MTIYINPYYGNNFFEFFGTLAGRILGIFSGNQTMVSDELQILVLVCISISSALVGSFLVLRKMTMLANALSHTILPGVVLAYLFNKWGSSAIDGFGTEHLMPSEFLLILAALFMAFLTTFLTEFLVSFMRLHEDASTGIVFTFLFSCGIILVTVLSKNAHIGVELLMGNVDALHKDDLSFCMQMAFVNLAITTIFFRGLQVTTFDPIFSRVAGFQVSFFGYLLMAQVAVTAVASFRAVGVLLMLAFLVGPVLIARLWTNHLKKLLLIAAFVGSFASLLGVALSRHLLSVFSLPVSTSALVVLLILGIYIVSMIWFVRRPYKTLAYKFA